MKKWLFVKSKPLLTSLEEKPLTQFQQEVLYILDDRRFEIRFRVGRIVLESKEL
jgi:hypothetical protein